MLITEKGSSRPMLPHASRSAFTLMSDARSERLLIPLFSA